MNPDQVITLLRRHRANIESRPYDHFPAGLQRLLAFLDETPLTRSSLMEAHARSGFKTFEAWASRHSRGTSFDLPGEDADVVAVCDWIVRHSVEAGRMQWWVYGRSAGDYEAKDYPTAKRYFLTTIVDPIIEWVARGVEAGSSVTYWLWRYKTLCQWFEREELLARVSQFTRKSEAVADSHLRKFLFNSGVDNAIAKPDSPSGEVDLLLGPTGMELHPLPLEVKLFRPSGSQTKEHVESGLTQLLRYMSDWNSPIGHLVVFVCEPQVTINVEQSESTIWTPALTFDDKTIFIVVIDIANHPASASKTGVVTNYTISRSRIKSARSLG